MTAVQKSNGKTVDKQSLALVQALLSGTLLGEIRDEQEKLVDVRDSTKELLERFTSADRKIAKEVILDVLQRGEMREYPTLEEVVCEESPQHTVFPLVIAALRAKVPIWLWGDAGSGKTTSAKKAANMLGLPFRVLSVCPTTTKSELFGYRDAGGNYHSTAFREIFEYGGIFLLDEIDNGNPSILSVLNTALANDTCSFPDGNIAKHEKALFMAAANTIGRGADVRYVGRNALDATTLDRFVFIRMDIDENLEQSFVTGVFDSSKLIDLEKGDRILPENWLALVQRVRHVCKELGLHHLVTPRATVYGHQLIQVGVGKEHLMDLCLFKGLRETDRAKILRKLED
jgi:cobaltochelatase CobS